MFFFNNNQPWLKRIDLFYEFGQGKMKKNVDHKESEWEKVVVVVWKQIYEKNNYI